MTEPKALKRMLGSERPMALLISLVKMMPEAPTRVPATIKQVAVEHEARRRHGESGERVQQRDQHRHVRAADGEHEDHAEHQSEHQDHPDVGDAPGDQRQNDHDADGHADQGVDHLLARVGDGTSGDQLLQLDERDRAPRERHRPDQHAEQHLGRDVDRRLQPERVEVQAARRWRSARRRHRPRR